MRFVSKRPIDFVFAVGKAGANDTTKEITAGESPTYTKKENRCCDSLRWAI